MNKSLVTGNLGIDAKFAETLLGAKKYISFSLANTEKIGTADVTIWYQCFIHGINPSKNSLSNRNASAYLCYYVSYEVN